MAYKRRYSSSNNNQEATKNDIVIELDKKKQVTVRKFNNINLVDIREFYIDKDTNEKKPGKKGISLTEETWKKLLQSASEIQSALDKLNGNVVSDEVKAKKSKIEDSTQEPKEQKEEEKQEESEAE